MVQSPPDKSNPCGQSSIKIDINAWAITIIYTNAHQGVPVKKLQKCYLAAAVASIVACGTEPPAGSSSSSSSSSVWSSSTSSYSSSSIVASSSSSNNSGQSSLVYAINVGGSAVTVDGVEYGDDRFSRGGSPHSVTDDIGGTSADGLYQSEKYGEFSYDIPVTNDTYDVKLSFAELYVESAGSRVFNVSIEGQQVASNLDLFSEAGKFEAYDQTFEGIVVSDESLTIELTAVEENPTLAGIALFSVNGEFVEPPPPPPTPKTAENPGADCTVGSLPGAGSLPNNANLPDPFMKLDGTRITDKSEWWCRRQEILKQAYNYIYGEKPTPPESVTGSVSGNTITVNVSDNGRSTSFTASINTPSGSGPFPVMIGYGGSFFGSGIPGGLQSILDRYNVATISYSPYDLGAENGGSGPKQGAFYDLYGSDHSAGLLAAWGWGVSRIIDVLEQTSNIDATKVGVTGCSRFGKGPFIASAFDARIALAIPVESGIGGVPALRLVPRLDSGGEQPYHAMSYERWLNPGSLGSFTNSNNTSGHQLNKLPVDTHSVIGLIAPRGLLVVDNPAIGNLDPNSAYVSTQAGQMIYDALGYGSNVGYIGAGGDHCTWRSQYSGPAENFVRKFLAGDDSANTGGFNTSGNPPSVNSYVDWTVPNLSGNLVVPEE